MKGKLLVGRAELSLVIGALSRDGETKPVRNEMLEMLEKKQKIVDVSTEEIQGWLIGTNPQPTNAAGESMSEHEYRIYLRHVNTQVKGQDHGKT